MAQSAADQHLASDLRAIAQRAMHLFDVAGASVAVMREDRLILCEGLGVRDARSGAPVDAETLFAIGSATKSFTTASLALLVEDGALEWDAPVRRYLPEFALQDPVASSEATPTDLACHRVGLPRHEFSWYKSGLTRAQLVQRLRYLPPSRPFRTAFQYQNVMFATLGYLVERIAGKTWEDFAHERILGPLGMRRTNFSVAVAQADGNHATPYGQSKGERREVPFANIDAIAPAGAINSCAKDMAQWLRVHLGGGAVDGTQLLGAASVDLLHRPQMVLPQTDDDGRRLAPAYALGWFTEVYMGHRLVHHGGNIDGFSAMVMLAPTQGLGIAVLSNQELSAFPATLAYAVVDRVLDLPGRDWPAYAKERVEQRLVLEQQSGDYAAGRIADTAPSHALSAYAGTYEHPAYGAVRIGVDAGNLTFSYHVWPEPIAMEHHHYDVFTLRAEVETIPTSWQVPFRTGLDGSVASFEIQFEPLTEPIAFRRRAADTAPSREDLGRLVGGYKVAGVQPMAIALQGDGALSLTLPGQPAYTLVPESSRRFALKGLPGFAVEFTLEEQGRARSGQLIQPNGIFPFTADD